MKWIDLLQPLMACQNSLLTTLQMDIGELEEALQAVEDDAQLAEVDLQKIIQKQTQILQMMSTISKLLSDAVMAMIRRTTS